MKYAPKSTNSTAFARAMACSAFGKHMPHPSNDNFVDRTPEEVAAARQQTHKTSADDFANHLQRLKERLAEIGQ